MIRVGLGGPDYGSIKFFKNWPRGFYVSPLVDNFDFNLQRFLLERYFENGAALFGRESPEEMQDIRDWAKPYLDETSDREVYLIAQYFVQRIRNYTHLASLDEARITWAWTPGCGNHKSRMVNVQLAASKLRVFRELSLQEYGEEVWGHDHGVPPFTVECVCRMEGVIDGTAYL